MSNDTDTSLFFALRFLLRFYEGVVELPLRKAQAVDPAGDATNERIDPERRAAAVQARDACYQVVTNVLKDLVAGKPEFAAPGGRGGGQMLPPAARKEDARALVGLAMRQGDRLFHERVYQVRLIGVLQLRENRWRPFFV